MHGGIPEDYRHHITIAVFDEDTGKRITRADVRARVVGTDAAGSEKQLEAMAIGGKLTYGGYFRAPGPGPYRIEVEIRLPGMSAPARTVFDWGRS